MLSPFFQPRYSTVLNEKSNSLLLNYTLLEKYEFAIAILLC